MIVLLDTNVVSELIRKAPDPAVEAWAASHPLRSPAEKGGVSENADTQQAGAAGAIGCGNSQGAGRRRRLARGI